MGRLISADVGVAFIVVVSIVVASVMASVMAASIIMVSFVLASVMVVASFVVLVSVVAASVVMFVVLVLCSWWCLPLLVAHITISKAVNRMLVMYLACIALTCRVFASSSNHEKKAKKKRPRWQAGQLML